MTTATDTDRLERIEKMLERIEAYLDKYRPVIEAYLDPAASGPGAWAVRRKLKR